MDVLLPASQPGGGRTTRSATAAARSLGDGGRGAGAGPASSQFPTNPSQAPNVGLSLPKCGVVGMHSDPPSAGQDGPAERELCHTDKWQHRQCPLLDRRGAGEPPKGQTSISPTPSAAALSPSPSPISHQSGAAPLPPPPMYVGDDAGAAAAAARPRGTPELDPAAATGPAGAPAAARPRARAYLVVRCDGGARGNGGNTKGKVGAGYILQHRIQGRPDELLLLCRGSVYLPDERTNNGAEYKAILAGIRAARRLFDATDLEVYSDSLIAVEQLRNHWDVRANHLIAIRREILEAVAGLKVTYHHVVRELNREADAAANRAMDERRDSEDLTPAGATLHELPLAQRGEVGCPRPASKVPFLYGGASGEDPPELVDLGEGCVMCGLPHSTEALGPLRGCDCGATALDSEFLCPKYCHVVCAGLKLSALPGDELPFFCYPCTQRHGPPPVLAMQEMSMCDGCQSHFRPRNLLAKSCSRCLGAGGKGKAPGGRSRRGTGAASQAARGGQESPLGEGDGAHEGAPRSGPIRAPPQRVAGPIPEPGFALPVAALLAGCKGSDPLDLLRRLPSSPLPIIPTVPAPARAPLRAVLKAVLTAAVQAEGAGALLGWALFLAFPALLLTPTPHGLGSARPSIWGNIKASIEDLRLGHLDMLLDRASQRAQENGARLAKDRAGPVSPSRQRSSPSFMPSARGGGPTAWPSEGAPSAGPSRR